MSEIKTTDSSRSWFCVLNSPEKQFGEDKTPDQIVDAIIDLWTSRNPNNTCAVNYEIGDTGNAHCHIVLCNKNKVRFSTIKNLFSGCHVEPTLGTKEQAEAYITKSGQFSEKQHTVVVPAKFSGEILGKQNNKTVNQIYNEIEDMIELGLTPEEIMSTGLKYRKQEPLIRKAYFAKRFKETPPKRDVKVYWHVGESGTGKTNAYLNLCDKLGIPMYI